MKSFENGFWEPTGKIIKYVWTGGPREEMPVTPLEDVAGWKNAGFTNDVKAGEAVGVVHKGDGSGNLVCPEFYIPGWLNEFGEATSCVNNGSPYVGEDKILLPVEVGDADFVLPELAPVEDIVLKVPVEEAVTIETVSEPVPVLANTGADPFTAGLIGVALLVAGLVTIFRKKIVR